MLNKKYTLEEMRELYNYQFDNMYNLGIIFIPRIFRKIFFRDKRDSEEIYAEILMRYVSTVYKKPINGAEDDWRKYNNNVETQISLMKELVKLNITTNEELDKLITFYK